MDVSAASTSPGLTEREPLGSARSDSAPRARLSIIIPAHNEEQRIGPTLVDVATVLPLADIIVVLNGCTDGTKAVVESLQHRFANLRLLEIEAAVGKGGAIRAGVHASNAEVIAYLDADGATGGAELLRLIGLLNGYDAVIGSRWIQGARVLRSQSFKRRVLSRGFNLLVRTLFQLPYSDTQCGAKVFAGDMLRAVIEEVQTSNLAIDVDILYALHRGKFRVLEVPTEWKDVDGTKVRAAEASFKMLASILRLRLRYSFLRYAVPIFDHFFPTGAMTAHARLEILICNWRDVRHPRAGGAETYLHEQAKRWAEAGHRVTWLTAGFRGSSACENIDGIDVIRVGNSITVYALLPLVYLTKLRDRFDIIIDAENGIPFFSPLFSMKRKKLLIFHVHRDVFLRHLPPPLSWLLVWVETWLMPRIYRNVDVITISDDSKESIERYGLTSRPIDVVRSGVDASLRPGERATYPLVSYVGRLRAYKRVDWLIEAFAVVHRSIPNARLAIAGAGDDASRLQLLARNLGVADSCEFHGFISESDKCALLQQSWLFVSPSSMEGWGIAVIEANACATPAVVFDVPGLREAVLDGVSGMVLEERDALPNAIERLLSDPAERKRLEHGALARAAEFSWDATAAKTLEILMRDVAPTSRHFVRREGDWVLMVSARTRRDR